MTHSIHRRLLVPALALCCAAVASVPVQAQAPAAPPIDTTGTIVHAAAGPLVVTMGLADMLVVHTPDATLVAERSHEEAVRKVVAELESRGWTEYL